MKEVVNLQSYDWEEAVKNSKVPVVVEFWHHRCPYCLRMEPIYAEIPEKLGHKAKITRMNILDSKENRAIAINEGVRGTPTIKVYCEGRSVGELVGAMTLEVLTSELERIIDKAGACINQSSIVSD